MTTAISKNQPRGKPFAKGQTGNPSGRPKMTAEEYDLIAACKTKSPDALKVIIDIMQNGEMERNRLSAAQSIIERAYGKPLQPTDVTSGGKPLFDRIEIVIVHPES